MPLLDWYWWPFVWERFLGSTGESKVAAQVEPSVTAQVQDAVEKSIARGLTAVVPHAVDCVSLDKERFSADGVERRDKPIRAHIRR